MREPLSLIVAIAKNGVIGREGGLPWHYAEDLRFFKRMTTGHAIIMGRKTHESIGKPLPNRRNIVVSRAADFAAQGCEVVGTLDDAVRLARQTDGEPFVVGGAAIYEAALPSATALYITEIAKDVDGDVRFPSFDRSEWREEARVAGDAPELTFVTLTRA